MATTKFVPAAAVGAVIGYVKDVKTSGTNGGTSSANTIHTRTLNTTEACFSDFGTLACDQFTLDAGTYCVFVVAPSLRPSDHQLFLFNITTCNYDIDGLSSHSFSGDTQSHFAILEGQIIITVSTTFEIRHWIQSAKTTDGLGQASNGTNNPQSNEIFTTVQLTKTA